MMSYTIFKSKNIDGLNWIYRIIIFEYDCICKNIPLNVCIISDDNMLIIFNYLLKMNYYRFFLISFP